jgi:hypothetical protein
MKLTWSDFLNALGDSEESSSFRLLVSGIGEPPVMSETPKEYNDPLGETKFYKFMKSGVEIGFREARLNHIHLFLHAMDGYAAYRGPLVDGVNEGQSMPSLIEVLGSPASSGGGTNSPLLGCRPKWIRYDFHGYAMRFAFAKDDRLSQVSLIGQRRPPVIE